MIDVGVGLWTMRSTAGRPAAGAALYRDLAGDARLAEALGFHSLWTAEHHFWYDGWCPAPVSAAAVVLGATTTLHAGTAVHLLGLWELERAAAAATTLAALSGGRLELGVGLGYRDEEFDGFAVARRTRGRRMDRALDVLGPRWATSPDAPRLLVGGFSAVALRRAGSRGLGIVLPYSLDTDELRRAIARYRDAAAEAGLPAGRVAVMRQAWPTDGSPEAAEHACTAIAAAIREYAAAWVPLQGRPAFEAPALLAEQLRRATATALVGTPEQIAEEVADLEADGVDLLVLQLTRDDHAADHRWAMAQLAPALHAARVP
jgi:alkanesulfonate monooxygenase SsuD/methylene tetrahydromethanopterin reductase-like flavin-dependent oxidoreductase (luciferase family)